MFENVIKLYDTLRANGENICPVAHTYISAHIGILIDMDGNFICALPAQNQELIPVPCTVKSACRTGGVAPHLLHDNLSYVAGIGKYKERYPMYIEQLEKYTQIVKDEYAEAILKYVKKEFLMEDAKEAIQQLPDTMPLEKRNVIFCVYGMDIEGVDLKWSEYYPATLPKNGLCAITGQYDYIPPSYPGYVLSPSDNDKLFLKGSGVGYMASEKIIHALQYMVYGKTNATRVELNYNFQRVLNGDLSEAVFLQWLKEKYNISVK